MSSRSPLVKAGVLFLFVSLIGGFVAWRSGVFATDDFTIEDLPLSSATALSNSTAFVPDTTKLPNNFIVTETDTFYVLGRDTFYIRSFNKDTTYTKSFMPGSKAALILSSKDMRKRREEELKKRQAAIITPDMAGSKSMQVITPEELKQLDSLKYRATFTPDTSKPTAPIAKDTIKPARDTGRTIIYGSKSGIVVDRRMIEKQSRKKRKKTQQKQN